MHRQCSINKTLVTEERDREREREKEKERERERERESEREERERGRYKRGRFKGTNSYRRYKIETANKHTN